MTLQDCKGAAGEVSPSLDRLLPHLGYVKGNIIVISHRANANAKNCASVDELMLIGAICIPLLPNNGIL